MLVVPVIAGPGRDLDDGDARIVLALGEPGLEHRVPQLLDARLVLRDLGVAVQLQEAGMLARLEEQLDARIGLQFLVLVAVDAAEEPDGAGVVGLAHAHRTHAAARALAVAGAKEARIGVVDHVLDTLDRVHAGQVAAVFFGLVAVDGIHRLLLMLIADLIKSFYSSAATGYVRRHTYYPYVESDPCDLHNRTLDAALNCEVFVGCWTRGPTKLRKTKRVKYWISNVNAIDNACGNDEHLILCQNATRAQIM